MVFRSIGFLNRNEIGSKFYIEQTVFIELPTIYICPVNYNAKMVKNLYLKDNVSLEDLESLPKIQDMIKINLIQLKLYDDSGANLTILNDHDELWQEFLWIYFDLPFKAMKCAEIKMPEESQQSKESLSLLEMKIDHSSLGGFLIEFRSFGESSLNRKPNWNSFTWMNIPNEEIAIQYNMKSKSIKKIENCVSENPQFHCIQKFMAWKLDCASPWLENFTTNETKKTMSNECQGIFPIAI